MKVKLKIKIFNNQYQVIIYLTSKEILPGLKE